MKVALIGVGRMGAQIGCEYLAAGHEVAFVARSAARARERLDGVARLIERHGLAPLTAEPRIVRAIDEVAAADLVVESVDESFAVKVEVLAAAAVAHPAAVLASNTSSLSIAALGAAAGAAERTIGTHYLNPPLLMPLVEVVRGTASDCALAVVHDALAAMGKRPVLIERDVPGFAWNRLQCALLREALWLVDEGVADPATVDEIVRDGLARRWRYTGPFETAALGGVATFERVAANLFGELSSAAGAPGLAAAAAAVPLDGVAARRDAGLAAETGR